MFLNSPRMACWRSRRLLGELVDGLPNGVLLVGRKLVQAVIEVLERLLLLGRKLVELLQPLLQLFAAASGARSIQRLLLLFGRHGLELFDRCLGVDGCAGCCRWGLARPGHSAPTALRVGE